ncbi:MAG: acetylornithine/succinylornithine family transaminase [Armatimonadetes bacterium]|nr:acetylornithine/succinylornithine family transaminase [Armatimonadota bacterium]
MSTPQVLNGYERAVQCTYGRIPIAFVRGRGARLWDSEGKEYLDFVSGGRAGTGLGHCHPRVVEAIRRQAEALLFVSNDFHHPWGARLGELLAQRSGGRKAFFCNSGTEASETAIKLARKWGSQNGGRYEIVTAQGSFHGRTLGALSATGQTKFHQGFQPLLEGFHYCRWNDPDSLASAVNARTCAIYLEPVQGESGTYPASPAFMQAAARLARERGCLLMVDEVQTGFGRTGRYWAYEHYSVEPHVIATAKALGGGLPIGACLALPEYCALVPGDHGCTFGGNPLCAAAAVAALEALDAENLVERAATLGERMLGTMRDWARQYPSITEVRGLGLMQAIEFHGDQAATVGRGALERGLITHTVGAGILRLLPPLCLTDEEADRGLAILAREISTVGGRG